MDEQLGGNQDAKYKEDLKKKKKKKKRSGRLDNISLLAKKTKKLLKIVNALFTTSDKD